MLGIYFGRNYNASAKAILRHLGIFFTPSTHVETCVLLVRECTRDDEMVSIKVDLEGISLNQGKFEADEKPAYATSRSGLKKNTI